MLKFSRGKLLAIIGLNFVIIALLLGLFFFLPKDEQPVDGLPEHQRLRTANISLNPALSWELQLMGSGEETAVASFVEGGYVYVFGNTDSSDLDFDEAGVFLAIVDVFGVTKDFFVYGESGDALAGVCRCNGGFLLAVQGKAAPRLLVVGYDGATKKSISDFAYGFEKVLGVKSYQGGYLLFTAPENNLTGVRSLRCLYFSVGLQFEQSSIAVSSYSLDLFDSVVVSGKAVALCNAVSTSGTLPAAVQFSKTDSPKVKIFTGYGGEIKGLSVYEGELLLLTTQDGSSLLHIDLAFNIKNKITLSQLSALGLAEVGSPDASGNQNYLAFVDTSVYLINGKGERKSTLPALAPNTHQYYGDLVLFAGNGIYVNAYSREKLIYSAALDDGENPIVALDDNNLFCVYQKDGDVFVVKLRHPLFW